MFYCKYTSMWADKRKFEFILLQLIEPGPGQCWRWSWDEYFPNWPTGCCSWPPPGVCRITKRKNCHLLCWLWLLAPGLRSSESPPTSLPSLPRPPVWYYSTHHATPHTTPHHVLLSSGQHCTTPSANIKVRKLWERLVRDDTACDVGHCPVWREEL